MNFHHQTQIIDLGIVIDHVATLRNVSGANYPDPIEAALMAEDAGADCISLHLREDRKHIRDSDVARLRPLLRTRMNLEATVTQELIDFACRIRPHDVCLVPESREDFTAQGGLDAIAKFSEIQMAVRQLKREGIRVSMLIDPDANQISAASEAGLNGVVFHTRRYAEADNSAKQEEQFQRIRQGALDAVKGGMRVNAGRSLNYTNVHAIAAIPEISELNIGHAIVAQAVFVGWNAAVAGMKAIMVKARLGVK